MFSQEIIINRTIIKYGNVTQKNCSKNFLIRKIFRPERILHQLFIIPL